MASALENILYGNVYGAIEVFSQDGRDSYAWLLVKKKRGELHIKEHGLAEDAVALRTKLARLPVVLCINTSQVVHKEVQDTDASDKKLLHKAFPNIRQEDFHFEIWRHHLLSVVAICRRSHIDMLLGQVGKGLDIVHIHLGVAPVSALQPFGLPERFYTNFQQIDTAALPGQLIQPLQGERKPADINGLTVPAQATLGFAGIVALLFSSAASGSISAKNTALEYSYKQRAFFGKSLKAAVIVVLALLLLNFIIFSYYFDKARTLGEKVQMDKAGLQSVLRLKERVKEKETLLEGFSAPQGKASEVINELVKDVPVSVLLSRLEYHPLEHQLKEGEAPAMADSLVTIAGAVGNIGDFNTWLERKQGLKSVKSVTIGSFGSDEEGNTVFTIKIKQK